MDRSTLLGYLRYGMTMHDRVNIIRNYCLENGKEESLIDQFIQAVIQVDSTGGLLVYLSDYVIEKESARHVIVRVYNKNNQLIHIL